MTITKKATLALVLTFVVIVGIGSTAFSAAEWCGCLNPDLVDAECMAFCGAQQCVPYVGPWGQCSGDKCRWNVHFTCQDGTDQYKYIYSSCFSCGGEGEM